MAIYGNIRTSRDQDPGHPGSDPEVQRRPLVDADVKLGRTYANVAVLGAKSGSSRGQWQFLDRQLAQGDILMEAAVDRLGRRYLETMWAIYDLQRRGVRLRSLVGDEGRLDQVLGRRSGFPGGVHGQYLGQYDCLCDQSESPEHQPTNEGGVGRC